MEEGRTDRSGPRVHGLHRPTGAASTTSRDADLDAVSVLTSTTAVTALLPAADVVGGVHVASRISVSFSGAQSTNPPFAGTGSLISGGVAPCPKDDRAVSALPIGAGRTDHFPWAPARARDDPRPS